MKKLTYKDLMEILEVSESTALKYLRLIRKELGISKSKPITEKHLQKWLEL